MIEPALLWEAEESLQVCAMGDVVIAQTRALLFARNLGFSRQVACGIAIAVSEAASNIVKYGRRGCIHLRACSGSPPCMQFEARDEGGGIGDLHMALRDGVSEGRNLSAEIPLTSRRGLGCGLGAIRRLMDRVEITSSSAGTSLRAEKDLRANSDPLGRRKQGSGL